MVDAVVDLIKINTHLQKSIEELQTIGIVSSNIKYTENELRKEHNATKRKAHTTWK